MDLVCQVVNARFPPSNIVTLPRNPTVLNCDGYVRVVPLFFCDVAGRDGRHCAGVARTGF